MAANKPFPVVDCSDWRIVADETSGVEEKRWLRRPDETLWLFKGVTEHETPMRGRWQQREDYAERLATALAQQLGVPCAQTELAIYQGKRGTISASLKPDDDWELQPGAVLLGETMPDFVPHAKGRLGHSLENIQAALEETGLPIGFDLPTGLTAFGVFAGYLTLDALVANQDRHEDNWAVLLPPAPSTDRLLCPSYDHGSCLGFNLLPDRCETYLRSGQLESYARKGVAQRFEPPAGYDTFPSLVDFARRALDLAGSMAAEHWLARVERLAEDEIDQVIEQVEGVLHPVATFTKELVKLNRRRLLGEC